MEVGKLTVQVRRDIGKGQTRKYRSQGLVPGVCYGANLSAPLSVVVNPKDGLAYVNDFNNGLWVVRVNPKGSKEPLVP